MKLEVRDSVIEVTEKWSNTGLVKYYSAFMKKIFVQKMHDITDFVRRISSVI